MHDENLITKISDANALIGAFNLSKKGSAWKESVQRYEANLLRNVYHARKRIRDGTYKQKPFCEFTLCERGKTRRIRSMHISDRVVQRSVCDNALIPCLGKYLIYDNGASVKGKGIDFTRRRLDAHLHKFVRENGGNDGYILLVDFSKFFDNIPHGRLVGAIGEKIKDPAMADFIAMLIDTFSVDVSYMTDAEYEGCEERLYNSLDHARVKAGLLTGEKMMHKSVGIGSQISQVSGVFYPTPIDNYCKIVRGLKYYGRYMDDVYIIHKDKQLLKDTMREIDGIARSLGLFVNHRKTQIVKLSHGFTWLKVKYGITGTGKITKRPCRERIARERRKLKKYRKLMDAGRMPYKDIEQAYSSWRGSMEKLRSYRSLRNMDRLYYGLFIRDFIRGGQGNGNDTDTGRDRVQRAAHT